VARQLKSPDVIDVLADLLLTHGVPAHIRSDQGPTFVVETVKARILGVGARTAYIEKTSLWENRVGRILQRHGAGQAAQRRGVHHASEGAATHRWVTLPRQPRPIALLAMVPSAHPEAVPMARSQISSGTGAAAMAR